MRQRTKRPSNSFLKRKCKFCGKLFFAYKHNAKKGFGNYCSKKCSNRGNGFGFKIGHKSYRTEEATKKIAERLRGRPRSEKTKEKIRKALLGRQFTEEHRLKISLANKGRKMPSEEKEHRKNLGLFFEKGHQTNLGKILTRLKNVVEKTCPICEKRFFVSEAQAHKRVCCSKVCLFSSVEFRNNISKRQIGRRLSEETKEKLSLALRGSKSSLWMGGKGLISMNLRQKPEYVQWRRRVVRRDKYQCVQCYSTVDLQADHIIPVSERPDLIFEVSNGRTVCKKCHIKITNLWRKTKRKSHD